MSSDPIDDLFDKRERDRNAGDARSIAEAHSIELLETLLPDVYERIKAQVRKYVQKAQARSGKSIGLSKAGDPKVLAFACERASVDIAFEKKAIRCQYDNAATITLLPRLTQDATGVIFVTSNREQVPFEGEAYFILERFIRAVSQ